ncbi:MAG: hypothetical protein MI923_16940 [Phycisphaerales bacterium]|nr:hypothetical protein [Phycisphaerales bacterium]
MLSARADMAALCLAMPPCFDSFVFQSGSDQAGNRGALVLRLAIPCFVQQDTDRDDATVSIQHELKPAPSRAGLHAEAGCGLDGPLGLFESASSDSGPGIG